jgi:multicomponent Na+:H+ antiporter subunit D
LVHSAPVIAGLFLVPALSLAGLPPFSGFLAKFALVDAGVEAGSWWIVATSLAVGLFTVFSMTKIWAGVFWGEADEAPARAPVVTGRLGSPLLMVAGTVVLVVVSVGFSIAAGALYELSERAARDLLDPTGYVSVVLGERR